MSIAEIAPRVRSRAARIYTAKSLDTLKFHINALLDMLDAEVASALITEAERLDILENHMRWDYVRTFCFEGDEPDDTEQIYSWDDNYILRMKNWRPILQKR